MNFSFSYSEIDITPPIGIRLGGYAHRLAKPSTHVHDPLFARLLYISGKDKEILLVQLDILGIYLRDSIFLKSLIKRETGIKDENIFITSIHTHSSPETVIPMWPNTFPYSRKEKELFNKWWRGVFKKIAFSSGKLLDNISRGSLKIGSIPLEQICHNRTFGEEGLIDNTLRVAWLNSKKTNVVLLSLACHPVCNTDLGISADYPGAIYRELNKRGIKSIFLTGSAGDMNPNKKGREYIEYIGKNVSYSFFDNLHLLKKVKLDSMSIAGLNIKIPLRLPDIDDPKNNFLEAYNECVNKNFANDCLVKLLYADEAYEISKEKNKRKNTFIHGFRLGKLFFITVPGEMFIEIEKEIVNDLGINSGSTIFLSNYSEDYIGYIPLKKAFELKRYEARLARWSRITPRGVQHLKKKLKELYKNLK